MKNKLFLSLILTLLSCKNTQKTVEVTFPKTVQFSELTKNDNSGYMEKKNLIIASTEAYDEAWNELFSNFMKKPPVPAINFETSMVILVTMGEKTNGGYSIHVKSITENEKDVVVLIEERIPAKNCMTTSVIVYPAQLIELPATDKEIIFTTEENIYSCEE